MGDCFINFYHEKIKKEYKFAFYCSFIFCILVHIYKFTNTLPNHDSLFNFYANQNVLGSGRWALMWACGLSSFYDLPWIIGVFSALYIALTVVIIVALFDIKNYVVIFLTGAFLVSSPATMETNFFQFTADGYFLAMFLSALSVYFARINNHGVKDNFFSGGCICLSCAVYQAYISFSLILSISYFMDILLLKKCNRKNYYQWIIRQVVIYIAALISYFFVWKILLRMTGGTVYNYQGISELGNVNISILWIGLIKALKSVALYFLQWNVWRFGFSFYSILSLIFLLFWGWGIVVAIYRSKIFSCFERLFIFLLCLVAIIPFACICFFATESVGYKAMMLQSLSVLYIFAVIIYERWEKEKIKNIFCVFLLVVIFNNSLIINISYFYMNLIYEHTYADVLELAIKINDIKEKEDFGKIAIIGKKTSEFSWEDFKYKKRQIPSSFHICILNHIHVFEEKLSFDSGHILSFLENNLGRKIETISNNERNMLLEQENIRKLPSWPDRKSMIVENGILIIKLSNQMEDWNVIGCNSCF